MLGISQVVEASWGMTLHLPSHYPICGAHSVECVFAEFITSESTHLCRPVIEARAFMCATLLCTGARRGAMMATLRYDHPDIEEFVSAKQDNRELRHFNMSVQVTDDFMEAIRRDGEWELVFPAGKLGDDGGTGHETLLRRWSGNAVPVSCRVLRRLCARSLWDRLMRATYDYAEPGVLFFDRISRLNNLW